jgi:hypothetical protein
MRMHLRALVRSFFVLLLRDYLEDVSMPVNFLHLSEYFLRARRRLIWREGGLTLSFVQSGGIVKFEIGVRFIMVRRMKGQLDLVVRDSFESIV